MGLFDRHPISSNRKTRFSLQRAAVDIIQLNRDFYLANGVLPLPAARIAEGDEEKRRLAAVELLGIRSLAAVFHFLALDNRKRVLVCGHADAADDQGGIPEHYALSEARARSAQYMLAGYRKSWGDLSFRTQSVRECQCLLKTFSLNPGPFFGPTIEAFEDCNPGAISGDWNEATERATRYFIADYNQFQKRRKAESLLSVTIVMNLIKGDDARRWPREMWEAVYDIYQNAIVTLARLSAGELKARQKDLLRYVSTVNKFVACGESFPLKGLDDESKSGYRPEPGGGVEILMFNRSQRPGKWSHGRNLLKCPAAVDRVHKAKECPIFYKHHMRATYLDCKKLEVSKFYLKFLYLDVVKRQVLAVPEGLTIKAFYKPSPNERKPLTAAVSFADGVYTLTVEDKSGTDNIFFEFATTDPKNPKARRWVYSDDTPRIVTKTRDEIAALTASERRKYYDLPTAWSSENYWTLYDSYVRSGKRYVDQMKDKGFKPFGGKSMAADKPLMFSLDDIVLVSNAGKQTLSDRDDTGAQQPLSEHSRVTLLYMDEGDKYKVKIHQPLEKEPFFSKIEGDFKINLIHDHWFDKFDKVHGPIRAAVFCGEFYHVFDRRTEQGNGFDYGQGHVLGARAAMVDDPACSGKKACSGWNNDDINAGYVAKDCGNYDLHFLHNCAASNGTIYSALVLYWSCRFALTGGAVAADQANLIEKGMQNAMVRFGSKDYQFEKSGAGEDIVIKSFILYEAKQQYKSGATDINRGGVHKCMITLRDDTGRSSMGRATADFRRSCYDIENRFTTGVFDDYGGGRPGSLTVAHEIGHACGLDDEYVDEDVKVDLVTYNPPQYYPGMPYALDKMSLMLENKAVRVRHYWGHANWINDASQGAVGPRAKGSLNDFLKGTKFKIVRKVAKAGCEDLHFDLTAKDNYKKIYKPAYEATPFDLGNHGATDLLLYKLGDDELSRLLKSGLKFKGIMVVRTCLYVRFIDGGVTNATKWHTHNRYGQWIRALDQDLRAMLDAKYRLHCNVANNDFAEVYLRVFPHYKVQKGGGGAAPAGTHFTLDVTRNGTDTIVTNNATIQVGDNVNNNKIIQYLFGKGTGTGPVAAGDLTRIATWTGHASRANGTFSVVNL